MEEDFNIDDAVMGIFAFVERLEADKKGLSEALEKSQKLITSLQEKLDRLRESLQYRSFRQIDLNVPHTLPEPNNDPVIYTCGYSPKRYNDFCVIRASEVRDFHAVASKVTDPPLQGFWSPIVFFPPEIDFIARKIGEEMVGGFIAGFAKDFH